MEKGKIETFVAAKSKYFTGEHLAIIRQKMESMPDEKYTTFMALDLKDPIIIWVVSFFLGYLGIDRFLVGSIGAGVVKLLTFGGFGLWWLIDLFIIGKKTREVNYAKILPFL